MKKFKVFLLILAVLLIIPFGVFADESVGDDATQQSNEVKVYLFHGDGLGRHPPPPYSLYCNR